MEPVTGIVLLASAWVVASSGQADEPPPDELTPEEPQTVPNTPTVSEWDDLLEEQRGDIPLDFLRRWISRESGGNPCSVGSVQQMVRDGYAREAGIGQLYFEGKTHAAFGVTSGDLRAACSPTSQSLVRALTDDERRMQVDSLLAMVRAYQATAWSRLQKVGVEWGQDDWSGNYQAFVKLHHALPALAKSFLAPAVAAGRGDSWQDFRGYILDLSVQEVQEIDRGAAPYQGMFARLIANAEHTGGLA